MGEEEDRLSSEPVASAGTLGWVGGENHDHQAASAGQVDGSEEAEAARTFAAWPPPERKTTTRLHL